MLPEVSIAAAEATVTEGPEVEVRFILTADPAPSSDLKVNVRVTELGSFLQDTPQSSFTIGRNATFSDIILPTDDDNVYEADGTITASIALRDGYRVGSPSSASVDVLDDDPAPPLPPPSPPSPPPTLAPPEGLQSTDTDLGDGTIRLDWDDMGSGVTYEVEQKKGKSFWEKLQPWVNDWKTLPFDHFTVTITVTITGLEAEIGNLVDGKTYVHRVRSVRGDQHSAWREIETQMPPAIPHLAHQKDHTVQYEIGTMPRPPLGAPPIAGPPPGLPPHPITTAITTARDAWNDAVGRSWPYLIFCEIGDCERTIRTITMKARELDNYKTTINAVSGEDGTDKGSTEDLVITTIFAGVPVTTGPYTYTEIGGDDCGKKTACVKPKNRATDSLPFLSEILGKPFGWGAHMKNMIMVIEEPAWAFFGGEHTRYIWTNDRILHDTDAGNDAIFYYLPALLMHEFGHPAGLTDLYGDKYASYLMNPAFFATAIPTPDIGYVKQVYRNEHGTDPH